VNPRGGGVVYSTGKAVKMKNWKTFAAFAACLVSACGGRTLRQELEMVPSTALAHIHVESTLPAELWALLPEEALPVDAAMLREMIDRGPLGITVSGISLTDFEPQLLLLSRDMPPDTMLAIATRYFQFSIDSTAGRSDLTSPSGAILGSLASRDGWTCLYLGPSPRSVMTAWLGLDRSRSLGADSSLARISGPGGDISLFIPPGMISFLRVAPIENWVDGWESVESAMSLVQPTAARLDASFDSFVSLEARLVRHDGKVSRVRVEVEDSGFTPEEMLSSLKLLLMAGGML